MFRYVGLSWNDADAAAREHARRLMARVQEGSPAWKVVVDADELIVLCRGAQAGASEFRLLQNDSGVVLGRLFVRCADRSTAAPSTFDERATEDIIESGGRSLPEKYWGRYVALLRNSASAAIRVLRDPTGGMPCLNINVGGVEVFFSRMEDGAQLMDRRVTINWDWLAAQLTYQRIECRDTGLNEVTQLLCGECMQLQRGAKTREFCWNPLRIAATNVIADPAEAAAALRATALDCVNAWASGYERILHTLSGGLDSSLVLTCLKDAPQRPHITCVNYYSPGSDSDERQFARIGAQRAGCELVERERDADLRFEALRTVPLSATPPNFRYSLENSRNEAQLAQEKQATAIFSGEGGDQMFYQARTLFAACDYWHRRGLLRGLNGGLFTAALDAARVDRLSIWKVLREAVQHQLLGQRWSPSEDLGRYRKLICPDVIESVRRNPNAIHPLFSSVRDRRRAPSGKLWHAYQLVFPQDFYDPTGGFPEDLERVTPLLSQPLIEVCLRIPTDVMIMGGWDRAIARRAFRHDAPREIILRKTKGGIDEYTRIVLQRNMPFVREMLLDGQLVRRNIIDREQLEEVLSERPTRIGAGTVEVYDYLGAEIWLARWP